MTVKSTARAGIYVISGFLLLCCLVLWWSFCTASGSNASLRVLQNRMQNLNYTYRSGNLAGGLILDNVTWQLENETRLLATQVELQWDPSCWRGKEICFSSIVANDFRIVLAPGTTTSNPVELPDVALPFSLVARHLNINELVIDHPTTAPTVFKNIQFNGVVSGSTVSAENLQLDWDWLHIDASGNLEMQHNYPVQLEVTLSSIDQELAVPIAGEWTIGGDLLELVFNGQLSKPAAATATGTFSALNRHYPALIDLQWERAQWPLDIDQPTLLISEGEFKISGNWPDYDTSATASISGTDIPTAAATLSGKMNSHRATFNTLELNTLGGTIHTTGSLKWRNGIAWNTRVTATELWPDLHWTGLKGLINGDAVFNGLNNNGQTRLTVSDIDSTIGFAGNDISIIGNASRGISGQWHLSGLEATSKRNTLTANGPLGEDSNLTLHFSLNSPEDFLHGVTGDLHGNIQLNGDIRQPDISGSATSSKLLYSGMTLQNGRINGTLRALGETESDVKLAADRLDINDQQIRDLIFQVNGSLQDHYIRVNLDTPPFSEQSIDAIGSVDESNNWNGQINSVTGKLSDRPIWLQEPVIATWINAQKTIAVQPHCWEIDITSVCTKDTSLIGKNGNIKFSLDQLDLSTIDPLLPDQFGIRGTLTSVGNVKWGPAIKPSIKVKSRITDTVVGITDPQTSEKIQLKMDDVDLLMSTQNNVITTSLQSNTREMGDVNAEIKINTLRQNYPLTGSVTVEDARLDWLGSYLPQLQRIGGRLAANAKIGGYLSAPTYRGSVSISDGLIISAPLPALENVHLQIELDNTKATLDGAARAGNAEVSLKGLSEQIDSQWQTDLRIKADNMQLEHEHIASALVSPDLKILVRPDRVDISGDVKVSNTDIVVNDIASGGVPVSSDVIIVDAVKSNNRVSTSRSKPVNTNIHVSLGEDVHFTGYGLNADLGGDFDVMMDGQHAPELIGNIAMKSGTYRSYGQDLLIRKGRITFVGPLNQAALSVTAVREVGHVLAGLQIDGALENPETTLFSEPALPDEEILSYVVLGRQLEFGDESADDSNLLARAALFMGITNGRKLSRSIADNLGIEELRVTSSGSGDDTQLMVSGKINDRLLVRYGIGVFNSVRTLFVRYNLAEQLYLETTQSFAEGLEKAIDIFYSFDF